MKSIGFSLAMLALGALPSFADGLPQPTGPVLLTITGDMTLTNGDHSASFDEAMLRDLGEVSFTTSTIWTEGRATFTGVSLNDLVAKLGIHADHFEMIAVNDYQVEVPISDAVPNGPIIAYEMDGKQMSLRDKGPLWLVYPYDTQKEYQSEIIYSRSIWQLEKVNLIQ